MKPSDCGTKYIGGRLRLATLIFFLYICSAWATFATAQSTPLMEDVKSGSDALEQGRNADAERFFKDALRFRPDSVLILNNLAISIARQGREDEAIALYLRVLRAKPEDSIAKRNLGIAYFRSNKYKAALPFLEAFAKETHSFQALDLTGLDLFALDRYQDSADYLDQARRLQPNDLETLDVLGKAWMRTGNYAGVTEVFSQIMAVHPDSAEAHVMMAIADDKLFREDAAIKEFQAAQAADPTYPGIHTGLGVIYWRNDNLEAAEREFREELGRYPTDPIANCTLGRILRRRNQPAKAIPYLESALAVNHLYRDALLELGEDRIALQQPEAAIEPLRKAVALQPNEAQAHYILGTALSRTGDVKDGAKERALAARYRTSH